jgi:hypothetical protein
VGALDISIGRANVGKPLLVHEDFLGGAAAVSIFLGLAWNKKVNSEPPAETVPYQCSGFQELSN